MVRVSKRKAPVRRTPKTSDLSGVTTLNKYFEPGKTSEPKEMETTEPAADTRALMEAMKALQTQIAQIRPGGAGALCKSQGTQLAEDLEALARDKGRPRDQRECGFISQALRLIPDVVEGEDEWISKLRTLHKERAKVLATALTHGWEHVAGIVDEKARRLGVEDAPKPQVVYVERAGTTHYSTRSTARGKRGGARRGYVSPRKIKKENVE